MSLEQIGHFFDSLRHDGANPINKARDRLGEMARRGNNHVTKSMTKDGLKVFLDDLFEGLDFTLSDSKMESILDQLNKSLEGGKHHRDVFLACWNFWLQDSLYSNSALIVVDVQNDFISGSLALKNCPAGEDGYQVIAPINGLLKKDLFDVVAYTLDWHPADHCSFIDNVGLYPVDPSSPTQANAAKVYDTIIYAKPKPIKQVLWPSHCVIDSWGAELHQDLKAPEKNNIITRKGFDSDLDSYSAFWNNGRLSQTNLFLNLLAHNITNVYVCGLALDYCVQFTALDAATHGFKTYVIEDATAFISHGGLGTAKEKFRESGVILIKCSDVMKKST